MKLLHTGESHGETFIRCPSCKQQLGKRIMDIKDKQSPRCPKCGSILKE